jgi:hypothetical protein
MIYLFFICYSLLLLLLLLLLCVHMKKWMSKKKNIRRSTETDRVSSTRSMYLRELIDIQYRHCSQHIIYLLQKMPNSPCNLSNTSLFLSISHDRSLILQPFTSFILNTHTHTELQLKREILKKEEGKCDETDRERERERERERTYVFVSDQRTKS